MFSVSSYAPKWLINQHINKRHYMHLTVGIQWFVTPIMYGFMYINAYYVCIDPFLSW